MGERIEEEISSPILPHKMRKRIRRGKIFVAVKNSMALTAYLADPSFKRRLTIFSGLLDESLAFRMIELEGFNTWSPKDPTGTIRKIFRDKRVKGFLHELLRKSRRRRWPVLINGLPDFIAKKGKEIYLIDIKMGKAGLTADQAKILGIAEKHSLKSIILRMKIDVKVKEANLIEMRLYSHPNIGKG